MTVKRQAETTAYLNLLVQEFRIWQTLANLTILERRLLVECDAHGLIHLARQKEALLTDLSACQGQRMMLLSALGTLSGCDLLPPNDPLIRPTEGRPLFVSLAPEEAACMLHVAEGIQTLAYRIGELMRGNFALAGCAFRRLFGLNIIDLQDSQPDLPALLAAILASGNQDPSPSGFVAVLCEAALQTS